MRHPDTTMAVPAHRGNRHQDVVLPSSDTPPYTLTESAVQSNFGLLSAAELAVHVLTTRFQIAPDLVALIAGLANLGGAP
jgi:hypothetical protein